MIKSRYFNVIAAVLLCAAVLASVFLVIYAANHDQTAKIPEYQKKLFDGEILSIDIRVDGDDWQSLLDNATAKEYISGDLVINGETFSTVGIRTKGNSSLTQVAQSDSDRYSLQFKFNHYVKGQTCYGLDSLAINNMTSDATYMKDYVSYEIMDYIGVPTPLVTYADVTVNGEAWGFYVVLERYGKSFLDRVYNTSAGQLYNVKIAMGQRDDFEAGNFDRQAGGQPQSPDEAGQGGGMGMPGGRSGGGSLLYNGEDPAGYSSIFDNAVFSKVSDNDKRQVVTAIQNLNEGVNLEQYFDVDEILRYLAAHTAVVNLDSYVSSMQQNYYIYERSGKLSILPWDYNLAFGGFQSGSAASVVNFPIDTPVSGVNMEDRPLIDKLLEVEEYRERYHQYLREIVEGYFYGGIFETSVLALDEKINEYVKNDVSAFFTHTQYEASLPVLLELGMLRAESIAGQLDGNIPSTTAGQSADSGALVDASHIRLSDLGTMGGGGGNMAGGGQGGMDLQNRGDRSGQAAPGGAGRTNIQEAMNILRSALDGILTEEQLAALRDLGLSDDEIEQMRQMQQGAPADRAAGGMQPPDRVSSGASAAQEAALTTADWIVYGVLGAALLAGILFLMAFKRRKLTK